MERQQVISAITDFLKDRNPFITDADNQTVFEIDNKDNDQVVIIQITKEADIWVRLTEPHSGYYCESIEEFKHYFQELINGNIEVAIGYENSIWKETSIVFSKQYDTLDGDYEYTIASRGGEV